MNIHDNVFVATNVSFYTYDVMNGMFNNIFEQSRGYKQYIGPIEIMDNCFIGANSIIMYNVKMGPNAIVDAGSVVTKNVLEGKIVGGNPAKVIGKFDDLMERRKGIPFSTKEDGIDEIVRCFLKYE